MKARIIGEDVCATYEERELSRIFYTCFCDLRRF